MTPNVNSSSDVRGFSIRGISQQGFGPEGGLLLSVKLDGATVQGYQGTFFGPFGTWDMDRVEIFRGPQSTQQGRNALAGAIVMKSADPEYRTGFRVRGRFGNFGAHPGLRGPERPDRGRQGRLPARGGQPQERRFRRKPDPRRGLL